ncbi:YdcF family protein [Glaciimonas sp. CA11.2]|uniref:YdcF family protein n=2 Tax=Glaciimonas sp. CA11.2 TaxID=3048601 RepID=UPI002AB4F201|nr:YdcF family protein [Glaciimonas sp. CA11.2]MDY7545652.1 YdcF family protein [Glaciimonas sp. CA11.2]
MHTLFHFRIRTVILLIAVLILFLGLFQLGNFVSTPSSQPIPSDLIVTLGGDSGARVMKALDLYKLGYAPKILITGIDGGEPQIRPAYLTWQALFFAQQGVKKNVLLFDTESANTWQEALNTKKLMEQQGLHHVIVVSDPPHMRRLSWVWGRVFADSGMQFRLVPSNMSGWRADEWWLNEKSAQFVLAEIVKFMYYLVRY